MKEGKFSFRQKKHHSKNLTVFLNRNKQTNWIWIFKKNEWKFYQKREIWRKLLLLKKKQNCVQQQQTSVCDFSHPIVIHTTIIIIIIWYSVSCFHSFIFNFSFRIFFFFLQKCLMFSNNYTDKMKTFKESHLRKKYYHFMMWMIIIRNDG